MINDIQIKTDFYYYREVSSRFNFFNMFFYDFNIVPSTYKKILNNIRNIKSKYFISIFKFVITHANKISIIDDIRNFNLNKEMIEIIIKHKQPLSILSIPLPIGTNKYISLSEKLNEDKSITDDFYIKVIKYIIESDFYYDDEDILCIPEKYINILRKELKYENNN